MENWNNLTKMLDKLKEDEERRKFLSELLIEEASKGDKETVKKVLQTGAHPNCYKGTYTPLIATLKGDFTDLTEFLVKIGANPGYMPHSTFIDAVWYALINQKYVQLNLFIRAGCNLNFHPISGMNLLSYATETSNVHAVELLLRHKQLKVNERDANGNTALHYNMRKAEMNNEDIVIGKLLLAAGANTMIKNKDGKTPSELAAMAGETLILDNEMRNDLEEVEKNQNIPPPPKTKPKPFKF